MSTTPLILKLMKFGETRKVTMNLFVCVLAHIGSDFTRFYESDPTFKINLMRVCGLLMSLIAICEASEWVLPFGTESKLSKN